MASKKSAAQLKPVKSKEMTQEEKFNHDVPVLSYKIKSQVIASKRIDCMVQLREEYISFFRGTPSLDELKAIQEAMTKVYEEIDKIIDGLTIEKLLEEEDLIAHMFKDPKDIKDETEMFYEFATFMYARPWAEMLLELKQEIKMLGD